MSLLACQNLCFTYDGKEVLTDLNFQLNQGDYLCIIGENGAGKSTLIKGLLNLKKPSSGEIIMGGGLKPNEIGYLPQQTQVQKDFPASVYEVVLSGCLNSLGKRMFYSRQNKRLVYEKLEELDIVHLKDRCYRELSGGQKQRVLLARALCATRKLLLLDEPVTGLDPVMTQEFYRLVSELNRRENITVIMVSHDVKDAVNDASHVLHLGKRQLFFGTCSDYRESKHAKAFLGEGELYA